MSYYFKKRVRTIWMHSNTKSECKLIRKFGVAHVTERQRLKVVRKNLIKAWLVALIPMKVTLLSYSTQFISPKDEVLRMNNMPVFEIVVE